MYLILNFDSAGLDLTSPSKNNMDDVIIKDGGTTYVDREIKPIEEILIPKHCVINMLHVLCGLPPVSYYHPNPYFTLDESIVNSVDHSYIRYDVIPKIKIKRYDSGKFAYETDYDEMYQSNKIKIDSLTKFKTSFVCNKTKKLVEIEGIHSWAAWKRYLGYELFSDVVKYMEECLGIKYKDICETYDLLEVIGLIKDNQMPSYKELSCKLISNGRKIISDILCGNFSKTNYNTHKTVYPNTNINGVKSKITLSGSMLIKITDEMYEMISENDGVATLLDGGVITIVDITEDIDNQENLSYEGWVRIGTV